MARRRAKPKPTAFATLESVQRNCPECQGGMWAAHDSERTVCTLSDVLHLTLKVRHCVNPECRRYHRVYRPEAEGRIALPQHEFGLDVIALAGTLRHREHRTRAEIHDVLRERQVEICERSVSNLLDRYEELLALSLSDPSRLERLTGEQGRVILAIDGLAPDMGHEVLWLLRDCISGEVLLARALLGATEKDLVPLLKQVDEVLRVPILGVISDGQHSIRNAVTSALPGVPHQLCQFHYLREAVRPIYEADRHAKKELKKRVRGVRPIERAVENLTDEASRVTALYCAAVRSAITDDGHPPLDAAGLKLHDRLSAISESLDRAAQKGGCPDGSRD
jgi:mutator family transposase